MKVIDLITIIAKKENIPTPFVINNAYYQKVPGIDKFLFKELSNEKIKLNDEVITDMNVIYKFFRSDTKE